MKINKKDAVTILSFIIFSIIISTYIVSSLIYKYPNERYIAFKSSNITKFEVALKIYGSKIEQSKVRTYNLIVKSNDLKIDTPEANATDILDILTVLFIATILSGIFIVIYLKIRRKTSINNLRKNFSKLREAAILKYNLNGKEFSATCIDASSYNIKLNNKKLIIWNDEKSINFINNNFTEDIGITKINTNSIVSFSRYGDFYTTLKSRHEKSFFGFIDGFVSFKNTIESKTFVHDKRETLVFINDNNTLKFLFFEPKFYDFLMHTIPQKEINFIYKISKTNKIDELNKLADLKEKGVIDDDEFINLKKSLLLNDNT